MSATEIPFFTTQPGKSHRTLPLRETAHRVLWGNLDAHLVRNQIRFHNLTFLSRVRVRRISPFCRRACSNHTLRRHLGTAITWYLQSHSEWAKLF
jgi:hypothetical protein